MARFRFHRHPRGQLHGRRGHRRRRVDVGGYDEVRLTADNERAVKHWGTLDAMALMWQIGAIPEPSAAR
jgi:predicted ester cyclase